MKIIYKIYIIDGRYAGRDDEPVFIDDMIQAIVRSIEKNVHYVKMYNAKQIDKRNRYWDLAEKDGIDWMIVIDSDEYIKVKDESLFERYLLTLNDRFPGKRCFPIANNNMGHFFPTPRLFKGPFNYRHIEQTDKISHGSLYDPDGTEVINEMYAYYNQMRKTRGLDGVNACVPFIEMVHDKEFRDADRINKDYVYYNDNKNRQRLIFFIIKSNSSVNSSSFTSRFTVT